MSSIYAVSQKIKQVDGFEIKKAMHYRCNSLLFNVQSFYLLEMNSTEDDTWESNQMPLR